METGSCSICGDIKKLTNDHLPPKNIFTKPYPKNLITIKSCFECNNGASTSDEAFKIMLALILGGNGDDMRTQPLFDSALKSIKHNRRIGRNLKKHIRNTYLTSQAGIIIEKGFLVKIDAEVVNQFEEVIKRITKGLYSYHYGHFIGKNTSFIIRLHNQLTPEILDLINIFKINRIGTGHFSYGYTCGSEDLTRVSLWLYEFYQKYWVSCSTRTISENILENIAI